jgi:hypothetical protein
MQAISIAALIFLAGSVAWSLIKQYGDQRARDARDTRSPKEMLLGVPHPDDAAELGSDNAIYADAARSVGVRLVPETGTGRLICTCQSDLDKLRAELVRRGFR